MATITLKNIPEDLHREVKKRVERFRRQFSTPCTDSQARSH
jgi:hypothetical protein